MSCFRMCSNLFSCHPPSPTRPNTLTQIRTHKPPSRWLNGFFSPALSNDYGLWIISGKEWQSRSESPGEREREGEIFHVLTINVNAVFYWAFCISAPTPPNSTLFHLLKHVLGVFLCKKQGLVLTGCRLQAHVDSRMCIELEVPRLGNRCSSNVSHATMETRSLHCNGAAFVEHLRLAQPHRVERHSK